MFTKRMLPLLVAGTLLAGSAMAQSSNGKVWITLGDQAYTELQKVVPGSVAAQSAVRGNGNTLTSLVSQEKVHLVQVDEKQLHKLSAAVHDKLHRCGGFIYHATKADGQKALAPLAPSLAAVRPNYTLDNQTVVNAILPTMQASNIQQTITELSSNYPNRYYTTTGGKNASNDLVTRWKNMAGSRTDVSVTQFTHANWPQKSVILTINGTDNANEVIVMGGHLDSTHQSGVTETTKAPGADDDASGIASLTEAYRAMMAYGYKPRRTIKIMAYAAEEVGLRGSAEIAANFKANNINVVGVLQLDMTNYKGAANDIYIFTDYTDAGQNTFVENLIKTYQPTLTIGRDVCNYGCSDHASWTNNGFYASMPFESSFSASNKNIHTSNDTFANAGNTAAHSLKFSKLALSFAVELGSDGAAPPPPANRTETFTGSLAKGATKSFGPFKVGTGGSLKASTTGTGDIDLYARKTSVPTTTTYDCKSTGSTATETCTINYTANGDGYVLLKGYTAGTYNLSVVYRPQ